MVDDCRFLLYDGSMKRWFPEPRRVSFVQSNEGHVSPTQQD